MKGRQYDLRHFQKILKTNGYEKIRQNGSHLIYSNGTKRIVINATCNRMVTRRLIKENNLVEVN